MVLSLFLERFILAPNEHYGTLPRDLEMLGTGCTFAESLFCNLKWLLLSSRLQALCCPRSWSLRSKMRLPPYCERGPTQGKGREERNLQYSAQLLWHVQGHLFFFFFTATVLLRHFLFLMWSCLWSVLHFNRAAQIVITCKMQMYIYWFWTWFLYWYWHEYFISEKYLYLNVICLLIKFIWWSCVVIRRKNTHQIQVWFESSERK